MTIIMLLVLIIAQVSRVAIPRHTTKYLWCIAREYCVDKMKKMGAKILLLFDFYEYKYIMIDVVSAEESFWKIGIDIHVLYFPHFLFVFQ